MLREKPTMKQSAYEVVLLDELVPQDHLLRKIDRAVDFSFIHDLCRNLYCPDNGRPAIEPELLFRMLFIGYLYGIKSETRLAQAVNENIEMVPGIEADRKRARIMRQSVSSGCGGSGTIISPSRYSMKYCDSALPGDW